MDKRTSSIAAFMMQPWEAGIVTVHDVRSNAKKERRDNNFTFFTLVSDVDIEQVFNFEKNVDSRLRATYLSLVLFLKIIFSCHSKTWGGSATGVVPFGRVKQLASTYALKH